MTLEADRWEAAYLRFETPKQEIRKFIKRLRRVGAAEWPRNGAIVELFCGRGNGLHALEQLGFSHIEGIDSSPRLLAQYAGNATRYVADGRHLPFANASKDVLIVQGGLHHLILLPEDLEQTLTEMRRVLRGNGRVAIIEPWSTPFLTFVHVVFGNSLARHLSNRLDALAAMIDCERHTYERWLANPDLILRLARKSFIPIQQSFAWGKWTFVGKPR